jgi:hypothetical protein
VALESFGYTIVDGSRRYALTNSSIRTTEPFSMRAKTAAPLSCAKFAGTVNSYEATLVATEPFPRWRSAGRARGPARARGREALWVLLLFLLAACSRAPTDATAPNPPDRHRDITSYRCDACFKASLDETRTYYRAHADADEAGALVAFFLSHGASTASLRPYTAGKDPLSAGLATLDALERGSIVLAP